ncbi:MAG: glycerol kinase GlpK [Deltaproteobacteria bacterium]|nr:glycerol kinase GlpK [Deltaproteobacteria bacterium]
MGRYIMALDQGTTSSRTLIFNSEGDIVSSSQQEFKQIYPRPGWVEHDPEQIWTSQLQTIREALDRANLKAGDISAIGIANQRETMVLWDRRTDKPIYNAIVWQCRRTANFCKELQEEGFDTKLREKTGLVTDAYFSGTKLKWVLDHVPGARRDAEKGHLAFGTIDSWLVNRLSGGKAHVTDYSNASRTLLYNIHDLRWDDEILRRFGIPPSLLPEVVPSSHPAAFTDLKILDATIPIAGIAGDQQAALFGQCCFDPGMVKTTYGTGCFMLMNTGQEAKPSESGLLTTIAWGMGGEITYALEGSTFIAGALIQWLRDELKLIRSAEESEQLASMVEDSNGVYIVPAFVGLGAPHWDPHARGAILGLTRGVNRSHLVRAAIESIAFQTKEVVDCMVHDSGLGLTELRVDGGAAANNLLCQFQADLLGIPIRRPKVLESTALGAAYLAGLAVGFWGNREEISANWTMGREFIPRMSEDRRRKLVMGWERAVDRSKSWVSPEQEG